MAKKKNLYGARGVEIDSREADAKSYPKMPSRGSLQRAGNEIKEGPPRILSHTERKFGKKKAKKQKIAILLSKARKGK